MNAVRRISALVTLALLPLSAHADPVTIVTLAVYALAAAEVITAVTAAWLLFAAAVYGTVDAQNKARRAAARARGEANASLLDRNTSVLQADPPWRVVYGRQNSGGDIVAIFASDKTAQRSDQTTTYTKADAYKHMVIVLAAHEVQAINEIYLDGIALGALDSNGLVTGGEFMLSRNEMYEIVIAAGASSTQPFAVSVLFATDNTLTAAVAYGEPMVAASYSLTAGNTVINNLGPNPITVTFNMIVPWPTVRVQKHLGSPTQTADAFLMATVPTEWTSTDRLQGLAYIVLSVDLENLRFLGGPPSTTADISGRLVLDTRTGITAWSENPALITRDFLTAEWGFNCLPADIDTTYCNAAANACDVPISLTVGATTTPGQPTYTCNGSFTTGDSREGVLADMCESMAGFATYGAKWLIQAGAWTAPVRALTDDDLDGQIEVVQGGAGMDEIFNSVRGSYVPAQTSVVADFDVYQNAAFVAADGQALYTDLALPFTNNKARCRNLARVFAERNRDSQIIRYPAKLSAFALQIGDRVTVTSAEYGFVAKQMRITDWQFGITAPVMLLMQEDGAESYDQADAATADPIANTALPNPWVVSALSSVVAASGTTNQLRLEDGSVQQRVRVTWAAITEPYLTDGSGFVYVQWRRIFRDPANVWQILRVPASEVYAYIPAVAINDALAISVFAENALGARGAPVNLVHTVTGTVQLVGTGMLEAGAATEIRDFLSAVAGTALNGTGTSPVSWDGDVFTPSVDCQAAATITFEALGQAPWDAARYVLPYACPVSDITGGSPALATIGASKQIGDRQGLTTARAAYSVCATFSLTAGVSYAVGLASVNVPSGSGNQVWNLRVHTELIKR